MSNYVFAPCPNFGVSEHPFVTWGGTLTDDEVSKIIAIGESFDPKPGVIANGVVDTSIRNSETSWIPLNSDTEWLYDKLAYIARCLNGEFYHFDLFGFSEHFQYTVYKGGEEEGGFYGWHVDKGVSNDFPPRKLSLVVQLTDPSEYEGGDLEIATGINSIKVDKVKGSVVAFPTFMMHRVTPVTSGIRRSLVIWSCGPSFR